MFIFKRKNNYYYIIFPNNKKAVWLSLKTKDKIVAMKKFLLYAENKPPVKISNLIDEISTYSYLSKKTISMYKYILTKFKNFLSDKFLNDITFQDISNYFNSIRALKPTTQNLEYRTLRSAFNIAIKMNTLEKNIVKFYPIPKIPKEKIKFISKEDFVKFVAIIDDDDFKKLILFAVSTGMRRGEIFNLKWSYINMDRKTISIPAFITKTKKNRDIPISNFTYNLLLGFDKNSDNVFPDYSLDNISKKFKKYCRIAGLPENIHFHNLRHTFASWIAINGGNIYVLKELLGHSSVKVTEVYASLITNNLKNEIDKFSIS